MNLETKIIIYKFTPQVFTLTPFLYSEQSVSLNRTSCFIMANTLFPLTKHFVSSYENKLFFLSVEEATRLFKTEQDRTARITAFGKRKIMWATFDVYAHWWLRSLTQDKIGAGATHVRLDGAIQLHGGYILSNSYDEFYDHFGVRPAMYIKLD